MEPKYQVWKVTVIYGNFTRKAVYFSTLDSAYKYRDKKTEQGGFAQINEINIFE